MPRLPSFPSLAVLAGLLLCAVGAVWFAHTLEAAYQRGRASGRLELAVASAAEAERQSAAAASALANANAKAIALERQQAGLQEKFDALVTAARRAPGAYRACLDARLVRALAAIGGDSAASARP